MNTTYKSNNNVVYSCKYHVVWCPKYRRKVLINGVDVRLKELLTEYATNLSVDILEMEIMPDHVHMLLEVDPQFGIHKAVKSFKGYTSRILRHEFPYLKTKMPTLWTNSYFVSTVGGAPLETVKQYIENQKTSRTFCRTVRRVTLTGKVKHFRCGAVGKPSLNRARVSRSRPETG